MVPLDRLAAFAVAAFVLIVVPGPSATLKVTGAAYLVVLGINAVRHRRSLSAEALAGTARPRSLRRIVGDGFVVGIANPKAIVFFAAVLPQFADPASGSVPIQLLVLGGVFAAIALVSDSTWGLVAGTARDRLAQSPRRLEALGGLGGLVMIGLGVRLLATGRKD